MNTVTSTLTLFIMLLTACRTVSAGEVVMPYQPDAIMPEDLPLGNDGSGEIPHGDLNAVPDARPIDELLHRYANRPYVALGIPYTPLTKTGDFRQQGIVSWYGKEFHGQVTSSGENYDMYAMTAAHPTLPIPSYARVTNLANQKSVVVRINDRGPFLHGRIIDLSYAAAHKLGILGQDGIEVVLESLPPTPAEILPADATPPEIGENTAYLQLGAFKSSESAESYLAIMRGELSDTHKALKIVSKGGLMRVHIGPYTDQVEARNAAQNLEQQLGFKPMVVLP
jgi:rare lipoprotein A